MLEIRSSILSSCRSVLIWLRTSGLNTPVARKMDRFSAGLECISHFGDTLPEAKVSEPLREDKIALRSGPKAGGLLGLESLMGLPSRERKATSESTL